MTTVVEALDRIARECSITAPASWAAATRREHLELRDDFLRETVDEMLDRIDWPSPIGKQVVIAGTGAESYSLPADFRRLARDGLAIYETTTLRRAGVAVTSDGAWTHLNQVGTAGTNRFYAIEGYPGAFTIKFERNLSTGASVTVSYCSEQWVKEAGGQDSSEFDADTDTLMLPRRALELGTVARFRARKGFAFEVPRGQFEAEMARLSSFARGNRTISFGGQPDDAKVMRVPVPDSIPSA